MLLVVIAVSASAVIYSIVTSSIAPTNSRSTSTSFTIDDVTSTPYQISVCARNTGMAPTYIARVYVEGEGGVLVIDETEIPDAPAQPGHKFPITFPNNLVSGDYLFTLATSSGNVTEATFYVNGGSQGNGSTPTRPIIVTVLLPANTTYTNASASYLLPINVAVSSPSPVTAIAQLDGTANITLTPSGGYYTGTATVSSGTHTIRIYATDSVGNVNSSQSVTFAFTQLVSIPSITVISPANITYPAGAITVNVSVTDIYYDIAAVIAQLDGTANITLTPSGGYYVGSTASLPTGLHSLRIFANNSAGYTNSSIIVYFSIDATPPAVFINSPTNSTFSTGVVNINVTIFDSSPVTAIAQLDGTANITLTPSGGYYTGTATVSSGTHTIRIYATDSVGNVNSSQSVTFTCTLDHTAPTVIINSPITNEDCYISDIVSVTASDPSGISYVIANVNGQNYTMTLQNGFYVLPFSQIAGDLDSSYYIFWLIQIRVPNVITIYATDSVGNVNSSQSVTFYYWKS